MTLAEWVEKEGGRGVHQRLHCETRLAYTTIGRAIKGLPIHRRTAKKLALATRNEVSVAELMLGSELAARHALDASSSFAATGTDG